jgi:hypothetical protein
VIIALIVAGSVLGYLLVGAVYARTQVIRIYKKAVRENAHWHGENYRQYWIKQAMLSALVPRAFFWPVAMVVDMCAGPGARWFMRPVTERQEHAAKLRRDAKTWESVALHEAATLAERDMATELAKVLREEANREDIR